MTRPRYKETYFRLIKETNLESIKQILRDHEYFDGATIDRITYAEADRLPYFLLHVDTSDYIPWGSAAMLNGTFVKIDALLPEWEGLFYLPLLVVREITNEKVKRFADTEHIVEHELFHLRQMIDHIDKHPEYIENSYNYSVANCDADSLKRSIRFEIGKLFSIELPAIKFDYESGERDYHFYADGWVKTVTCKSRDEFIKCNLAADIGKLQEMYLKRFPGQEELINRTVAEEANRRGKTPFGKNAIQKLVLAYYTLRERAEIEGKKCEIGDTY